MEPNFLENCKNIMMLLITRVINFKALHKLGPKKYTNYTHASKFF